MKNSEAKPLLGSMHYTPTDLFQPQFMVTANCGIAATNNFLKSSQRMCDQGNILQWGSLRQGIIHQVPMTGTCTCRSIPKPFRSCFGYQTKQGFRSCSIMKQRR